VRRARASLRDRRVLLELCLGALASLAITACGSGHSAHANGDFVGTGTDGGGAGGGGREAGSKRDDAGVAPDASATPNDGGEQLLPEGALPNPDCAAFPPGPCGNGILNCGEECDGTAFFLDSCVALGFTAGKLACTASCKLDKSGCTGVELCTNGTDDDGDGLIDCADPDCAAACGDSCDRAMVLTDPGDATGTTIGLTDSRNPSCAKPTGGEAVYTVLAAVTGTMTVTVRSSAFLGVSFRSVCKDVSTELACGLSPLSTSVTAGQQVYIVVEPFDPQSFGDYEMHVETTP
jgi:hypothetical protein